jgi:hypothetical protein
MANDNFPGPDFNLENTYIECVSLSFGKQENLELRYENSPRVGSWSYDGIALRVLSAISEKKSKYQFYIEKKYIDDSMPYVVFISYGMLNNSIFERERNKKHEVLLPLLGVGYPVFIINLETNEGRWSYSFRDKLNKANGTTITTDAFRDGLISMIIVTSADLGDKYNAKNTVLFVNPFSDRKVNIGIFSGYNCWEPQGIDEYSLKQIEI